MPSTPSRCTALVRLNCRSSAVGTSACNYRCFAADGIHHCLNQLLSFPPWTGWAIPRWSRRLPARPTPLHSRLASSAAPLIIHFQLTVKGVTIAVRQLSKLRHRNLTLLQVCPRPTETQCAGRTAASTSFRTKQEILAWESVVCQWLRRLAGGQIQP